MGWQILIITIAVVTLGGLGSLSGTVISAFVISFTEVTVSSIAPQFAVAVPLIVIVLVIIVKPEGLLGEENEVE